MRFLDKTFFRFLFGFACILAAGLFFLSHARAVELVNINTAGLTELQTLTGIGPSKAQAIVDFRTQNGLFQTIDDIKKVSGIKDATFAGIKDYITVGNAAPPAPNSEAGDSSMAPVPTPSASAPQGVDTLKVSPVGDKKALTGEPVEFRAAVSSERASVSWSFGDGAGAYGPVATHSYAFPGEYVVVMRASFAGKVASARGSVSIGANLLRVSYAGPDRIEVYNPSSFEANLSGKALVGSGREFDFPPDTIIKAGQKISFASATTGLTPFNTSDIALASQGAQVSSSLPNTQLANAPDPDIASLNRIYQETLALVAKVQSATTPISPTVESASSSSDANLASASIGKPGWLSSMKHFFGFK